MTEPTPWHVVVTGSSGGIGRAVCSALLDRGHAVTGVDAVLLGDAPWAQVQADLSVQGAAYAAGERARAGGSVTHLVHCAAVQLLGRVGSIQDADWMMTLRVNVLSLDELLRSCVEDLARAKGSIVAVSSVHASASTPDMAAYATSKAALQGWVRAAALDLAPRIRVNAIQPGAVMTEMLLGGLNRRPDGGSVDSALGALARRTPLGVIAAPADLAPLVLFLLDSASSRFITGASFVADGGALLKLGTE